MAIIHVLKAYVITILVFMTATAVEVETINSYAMGAAFLMSLMVFAPLNVFTLGLIHILQINKKVLYNSWMVAIESLFVYVLEICIQAWNSKVMSQYPKYFPSREDLGEIDYPWYANAYLEILYPYLIVFTFFLLVYVIDKLRKGRKNGD